MSAWASPRSSVVRRRRGHVCSSRMATRSSATSCSSRSAAARRPDELGLETVGLEPGRTIEVDDALRAPGSDWLYAIGDVNGRALLTHMGKYQARIASDVILGRDAMLNRAPTGRLRRA